MLEEETKNLTPEEQEKERVVLLQVGFPVPECDPIVIETYPTPNGRPKLIQVKHLRYWALYPFQAGTFCVILPTPKLPPWPTLRKEPTRKSIEIIKKALNVPLNVLQVRKKLLEFYPNADVDKWTFTDLVVACARLTTDLDSDFLLGKTEKTAETIPPDNQIPPTQTDKPPLGEIAGLIYEKLKSLPEHKAMTLREIADWLSETNESGKAYDETTIRTKHLPQLKPYGLRHKKRIGYYLR